MLRSLFAVLLLACLAPTANAQEAGAAPLAIRVTADSGSEQVREEVERVIRNDLQRSVRVTVTDAAAQALPSVSAAPAFPQLVEGGARFALPIEIASRADGWLTVSFRLYDVSTATQIEGLSLASRPTTIRRVAHRVADAVVSRLGGAREFESRIAGIDQSGRLMMIDSDGANPFVLSRDAARSPAFVLTPSMLVYARADELVLLNLDTNRRETLAPNIDADAGVAAARASDRIAFARRTEAGDTDLHLMRLSSRADVIPLTRPGWQGQPSFSADGRYLAFLSEEEGSRRIATADLESDAVRLIGEPGDYRRLAWSPDASMFAVVRATSAGEELVVLTADSGGARVLATAANINGVSWSPGGGLLAASLPEGLALITVANGQRRMLPGASELTWSSLQP